MSHRKALTAASNRSGAELFILPQYLQTVLEPRDHDGEPGFLDLLLQPIGNVGHYAGPPDIHEMLELIERQEAHAAALDRPQTDALAYRVATEPKRIAKLVQQSFRKALDRGACWHFRDQYGNLGTPLVIDARMEAGEIGDDGCLPAAALADQWAAVRFGGGVVTIEARLDSRDRRFEEWIFDQYPFGTIH